VFEAPVFPPVCAKFVPSPPTFSDQIRIALRKPPGNKNRRLHLPSITEIQQALQPDFGPTDPIHIDGEVPRLVSTRPHVMTVLKLTPRLRKKLG